MTLTRVGHSCRTFKLVGHSCGTLLCRHSCRTLLWDTLVEHSCRALLWDTRVGGTLVGHSCRTVLWDTLVGLCRTLLWGTTTKVSKNHPSGLQNERFARDILKKSSGAGRPIGARASSSPAKQFRDSTPPENTRSHANPTVTATITSARTTQIRASTPPTHRKYILRLPRNVATATPRNFTIPCACRENCTSTPQIPHTVLRLPQKVTIYYIMSDSAKFAKPHIWNDFDTF